MQFGPIMRMPYLRHTAISFFSRSTPAGPTSRNPELMTTIPLTPFWPHSSAAPSTLSRGTMIIARSTSSGIAATEG